MIENNGTFILALLGAMAWVPQVISWINTFFIKPKLRFVPDETAEIGYTFGPILKCFFAILSNKKDALIEKIILEVTHEKGEKHNFYWKFLEEKGPELINISGETAQWRKKQSAIALKINTAGLTERKIVFHDTDFQDKLVGFIKVQDEKMFYLERTNSQNYKEEAVKTKEFLDVLDFVKNGFYWKEGKYTVILRAYEATLKKPHIDYFKFELTREDVALLEKNIKETQEFLKDEILYRGKEPKNRPQHYWNRANPKFIRKQSNSK